MCRIETEGQQEPKVYGVLTDYDLSSLIEDLKGDYTRTSQQRTGTPPYMARELLQPECTSHLYRHDVESLFYVMLLMCGRHIFSDAKGEQGTRQVVMREDSLPYENWFDQQHYRTLAAVKSDFIQNLLPIELSKPFEVFRPWLEEIRGKFTAGFACRALGIVRRKPFNDETLGGEVDYSTILDPIPCLEGELKGLTIRYKSSV